MLRLLLVKLENKLPVQIVGPTIIFFYGGGGGGGKSFKRLLVNIFLLSLRVFTTHLPVTELKNKRSVSMQCNH